MAFTDLIKGQAGRISIVLTVVALAPVVLPLVARAARPAVRAVLKAGVIAYEKGRETLAEGREMVNDVVAEVRAELEEKHAAQVGELLPTGDEAGMEISASAVERSEEAAAGELKKTA